MLRSHLTSWCYSELGKGSWVAERGNIRMLKDSVDRGAIDYVSPEFEEWWIKMKECIWNSCGAETGIPKENEDYLLHAVLANPDTPPQIVHLLLKLNPDSVYLAIPGLDDLPIHIAASTHFVTPSDNEFDPFPSSKALALVVEFSPKCAAMAADGQLPLHLALQSGKAWSEVKCLVEANEKTINIPHPESGLYPFQIAAQERPLFPEQTLHYRQAARKNMSEEEWQAASGKERSHAIKKEQEPYDRDCLGAVYEMLRRNPLLIDHAKWCEAHPVDTLLDGADVDGLDDEDDLMNDESIDVSIDLNAKGSFFNSSQNRRAKVPNSLVFASDSAPFCQSVRSDFSNDHVDYHCSLQSVETTPDTPKKLGGLTRNMFKGVGNFHTPTAPGSVIAEEQSHDGDSIFADCRSVDTCGTDAKSITPRPRRALFNNLFKKKYDDDDFDTRSWREPDSAPIDYETRSLAEPKRRGLSPKLGSAEKKAMSTMNLYDMQDNTASPNILQRAVNTVGSVASGGNHGFQKKMKKQKYTTSGLSNTSFVSALNDTKQNHSEAQQVVSKEEWDSFRQEMRQKGSLTSMRFRHDLSAVLLNRPRYRPDEYDEDCADLLALAGEMNESNHGGGADSMADFKRKMNRSTHSYDDSCSGVWSIDEEGEFSDDSDVACGDSTDGTFDDFDVDPVAAQCAQLDTTEVNALRDHAQDILAMADYSESRRRKEKGGVNLLGKFRRPRKVSDFSDDMSVVSVQTTNEIQETARHLDERIFAECDIAFPVPDLPVPLFLLEATAISESIDVTTFAFNDLGEESMDTPEPVGRRLSVASLPCRRGSATSIQPSRRASVGAVLAMSDDSSNHGSDGEYEDDWDNAFESEGRDQPREISDSALATQVTPRVSKTVKVVTIENNDTFCIDPIDNHDDEDETSSTVLSSNESYSNHEITHHENEPYSPPNQNSKTPTPNKKRFRLPGAFRSPTSVEDLNDDLEEMLWPLEIYWPLTPPDDQLSQLGVFIQEAVDVTNSILHDIPI